MRVLQLHTRYRQPGGEDGVVAGEAALLRAEGLAVEQFVTANPTSVLASASSLLVAPWNPRAYRAVRRVVRRVQPDVAHVHNTWFALSPSVTQALRDSGVPVVMTVHNYRLMCANGMLLRDGRPCEDCVARSPLAGVKHRCYRGSFVASSAAAATIGVNAHRGTWDRNVDVFIAPTEFVRARLLKAGFPAAKVHVKAHSVADPGPREAPPSRSRTVLFVGRLSQDKGADVLCDAWEQLGPQELELVVIGDGPLKEELSGRPRLRGVRFLGQLAASDIRGWMLRSRVLVAPSAWYETFGLVVAEAMAAGLPVITRPESALSEVAGDAVLPPRGSRPGDPGRGLVAALRSVEEDPAIDAAGAAGRARYLAAFTGAVGVERLLAIYDVAKASHHERDLTRSHERP